VDHGITLEEFRLGRLTDLGLAPEVALTADLAYRAASNSVNTLEPTPPGRSRRVCLGRSGWRPVRAPLTRIHASTLSAGWTR